MSTINNMDGAHPNNLHEQTNIVKKYGTTIYEVYIHFSQNSKETMTDKIMRLIRNDINTIDKP